MSWDLNVNDIVTVLGALVFLVSFVLVALGVFKSLPTDGRAANKSLLTLSLLVGAAMLVLAMIFFNHQHNEGGGASRGAAIKADETAKTPSATTLKEAAGEVRKSQEEQRQAEDAAHREHEANEREGALERLLPATKKGGS